MTIATPDLDKLDETQLRNLAGRLIGESRVLQAMLDKLTHEMAVLKRLKPPAKPIPVSTNACCLRRLKRTWLRSQTRLRNCNPPSKPHPGISTQSASRCRPTCHAAKCSTNLHPLPVIAAAR